VPRVERTLLSAAFDFDFDSGLLIGLPRQLFRHIHRAIPVTDTPVISVQQCTLDRGSDNWDSFSKTGSEAAPNPFSAEFEQLVLIPEYFTYKSFKRNILR